MGPPTFSLEGVDGVDSSGLPSSTPAEEQLSNATTGTLLDKVGAVVRSRRESGGYGKAEVLMGNLLRSLSSSQPVYERDFEDTRNFHTLSNLESSALKAILPEIIGPAGMAQIYHVFKDEGCGLSGIRQLLDLYSTQICKSVLPPFRARSPCWICGFPITGRSGTGAFSLQCGSILPASQAPFFVDLTNSGNKELANACYGYSHKLCATLRDDRRFLRIGARGKGYEMVSDAELKAFLRHLYEHGESRFVSDGRALKDAVGPNYTQWSTSRLPIVKARIQTFLTKVQSCPATAVMLGGLVSCHPSGAGKTRRRRRGGKTRRRS